MKKLVALMLALLMAMSMLAACAPAETPDESQAPAGSESKPAASENTPAASENTPAASEPETEEEGHGLPDLNYNDAEINIACWASPYPEFDVAPEDGAGDPVINAVYQRNLYTEQLLGVDLVFSEFYTDEGKTGIIAYAESLKNATSDPSVSYDIIGSYSRSTAQCFVVGLLQPLDLYETLDLSKSWWPKNIQEEFSMNGRLYFVSGDISTNMLNYMYGVFYNKGLTDDYGHSNLTDLVNNNEWTLEKLVELSTGVYQNIDETAGKSKGDLFGITFRYHMMDAVIQGSNFKLAEVTNENAGEYVKISEDFTSEKFDAFISDMIEYVSADDVYNEMPDGSPGGWGDAAGIIFKDGRSFFAINRMMYGFQLQETDITYGILPIPKYDTAQEHFNTCVDNSYTLYGICTDTQNGDRAAAVIQSLGYYGKMYTTPAIFDVTFKGKFSKEPAFIDMFDKIREGVGFDVGRLFTVHMNLIADIPTLKAIAQGAQWSVVASKLNLKATERAFKSFNQTIDDILSAS